MRHVSIDYDVTTPANTMLTAESGSGDLQLCQFERNRAGAAGSGSIRADKLGAGPSSKPARVASKRRTSWAPLPFRPGQAKCVHELGSAGDVVAGTGSGSIKLTDVQGADQGGNRLRHPRDQRPAYFPMEAGDGFRGHRDCRLAATLVSRWMRRPARARSKRIFRSPCGAPSTSTTSPEPSTAAALRSRRKPVQGIFGFSS